MTENIIPVSLIGERLRANWLRYLGDVLSSTVAEIDINLPLEPEQYADLRESDELFELLELHELSALIGYLEAITNLLDGDMQGADAEGESNPFWYEASLLQTKIQWVMNVKQAKGIKKRLKKFSKEMGLSAE